MMPALVIVEQGSEPTDVCVCACAFFGEGFRMAFSLLALLTITTPMDFKFAIFMELTHFVNRGGLCFVFPSLGALRFVE